MLRLAIALVRNLVCFQLVIDEIELMRKDAWTARRRPWRLVLAVVGSSTTRIQVLMIVYVLAQLRTYTLISHPHALSYA